MTEFEALYYGAFAPAFTPSGHYGDGPVKLTEPSLMPGQAAAGACSPKGLVWMPPARNDAACRGQQLQQVLDWQLGPPPRHDDEVGGDADGMAESCQLARCPRRVAV
ncbi:hypothetical protein GCM10028775_79120 [Catellatospora paridis]